MGGIVSEGGVASEGLRLFVFGVNGPFPGRGAACSGYGLAPGGATGGGAATGGAGAPLGTAGPAATSGVGLPGPVRVLLDCGPGVLGRFLEAGDYVSLEGVVLSHLHFDHISDALVLGYAMQSMVTARLRSAPLPIFAPPEPSGSFEKLTYKEFTVGRAVGRGDSVEIAGMLFEFGPAHHAIPSNSVRVTAGGKRFVYTSDTCYLPELVEFARGADLLLAESSFRHGDVPEETARTVGHMSAADAARLAAEAGVRRLLITHFAPLYDPRALLAEARAGFPGCEAAVPGRAYDV